jgi:L-seryl-tRNA(Ser) seleniumtransferase
MDDVVKNRLLRALPSVDEVLSRPSLAPALSRHPRARAVAAARKAVEAVRARLLSGTEGGVEDADVERALAEIVLPGLTRVLNATGVVLHTNLGRAPLAEGAAQRVAQVAAGYSNLEYDLDDGERGSRYAPVVGLLRELTGAEDAVVVNNNAAAVLLALAALAEGREVVVSRGELVEIGGGFRIPDVMRQSGARLVEVGTTNRTRIEDYAAATGPQTALLMKVHRSNFEIIGFTEETSVKALAGLARSQGVPLFEDLGSGAIAPLDVEGLPKERTVRECIAAGADVCAFSGDKLLGGPQAGVLVGRAELIALIRKHPLNRAVRVDKMTVAALEATLELYRDGCADEIPARRLLSQTLATLHARAQRLHAKLREAGIPARVVETTSQVGGGAMPGATPASSACVLDLPLDGERRKGPLALQRQLRAHKPPVVSRVAEDQVVLDVRCLSEEDLSVVAEAVAWAW